MKRAGGKSALVQTLGLTIAFLSVISAPGRGEPVKIPKSQLSNSDSSKARGEDRKPRFYLVAIGVERYEDDFWPDLKWPEADAAAVAKAFGKDTGFQIRRWVIKSKGATRAKIWERLRLLQREVRSQDLVVIYYSGHGTLARGTDGDLEQVLVTTDATARDPYGSGLPQKLLSAFLDNLPARRKLAVFATCHSGAGKSKVPEELAALLAQRKGSLVDLTQVSEGTLLLSAAAHGEVAREDDRLKGDVYTHFLLEGLRTYDRNEDGVTSALEAHDYAKQKTFQHSKGRQRPTALARFVGEADVPLRGQKDSAGSPVLTAYDDAYSGLEIAIGESAKGTLPLAFPLAKGENIVKIYGASGKKLLAAYKVQAANGETISLAELRKPAPIYVGVGLAFESFQDQTFEKLTGSMTAVSYEAKAGYRYSGLSLGIVYRLPSQFKEELAPRIASKSRFDRVSLLLDAHFGVGDYFFRPEVAVGSGTVTVSLHETAEGATIKEVSDSLEWHIGLTLGMELRRRFQLLALLAYRHGDYDFGELGRLAANRHVLGLGLSYEFGGKGVRIR